MLLTRLIFHRGRDEERAYCASTVSFEPGCGACVDRQSFTFARGQTMPTFRILPISTALAVACLLSCASANAQPQQQEQLSPKVAAPAPYKKVSVSLPAPIADQSLNALRKQLADVAQRKDRPALRALVVPQGFFWEREDGTGADEKKSGADNLAAAIGLDAADGSGWDFLADYADETTASAVVDQKDTFCSPGHPAFSEDEFMEVVKSTGSNPFEWGYPLKDGIEAHTTSKPDSPVVEKLGLHFIRVMLDAAPPEAAEPVLRIVTPSGTLAFIPAEELSPIGIDQLCYVKLDGAWKIVGYVGEGAAQ
jgi:hypothetical protein